jgi:lipoprotein NlpD
MWPTTARVSRGYSSNNSGLDFALTRATPIKATAAGVVVYAGTGLGGFRQLVIIKHDERFLSAYSLQQTGHVEEGESLRAGQLIASVTNADRAALTLHFEIRKNGQPVDPRSLLGAR